MANSKDEKSGSIEPCDIKIWDNNDFEKIDKIEFLKILNFFIFHSPCKNSSVKGIPLNKYGWDKNKVKKLKANLESELNPKTSFKYPKTLDDMKASLESLGLSENFPIDCDKELVCFSQTGGNLVEALCYHIRNCFAHGRFNIIDDNKNQKFIFEDKSFRGKKVSARMILKKSTLLKWIEIIEGGEKNS